MTRLLFLMLLLGICQVAFATSDGDPGVQSEVPSEVHEASPEISEEGFLTSVETEFSFGPRLKPTPEGTLPTRSSRQPASQGGVSSIHSEKLRSSAVAYMKLAKNYYREGDYFSAARFAFGAGQRYPALKPLAYAWITRGLIHAGLPNAAAYFFIRTLQEGSQKAIRSVLTQTQPLLVAVGPDLLRKYLIRHTRYEDYNAFNRNAYLYALGKDALLMGDERRAMSYFDGIQSSTPLWPYVLQLRATTYALLGKDQEALRDFRACAALSGRLVGYRGKDQVRQTEQEAEDLRVRCLAGEARTHYQMNEFMEADLVYDQIPKKSFVWADILFEQGWNAFGKQEFNRTLGKLVSYKNPALSFVFNSEVDVLRAQTYLALCLYSDANETIREFNENYSVLGEEIKKFVETNSSSLPTFYEVGKSALKTPLHTQNNFYRLANRFVRGPYFQSLVAGERQVAKEREVIRQLSTSQGRSSVLQEEGFPGFLNRVLNWRLKVIRFLGGAFIKNSLLDYHSALISDYEKTSFIKLEMLKKAKEELMNSSQFSTASRERGSIEPQRRNDQYRWSFNGEFWSDEVGDYVFGLESACK